MNALLEAEETAQRAWEATPEGVERPLVPYQPIGPLEAALGFWAGLWLPWLLLWAWLGRERR